MTIIDDDKPGFLSFQEKRKDIKHVATEEFCKIIVDRTNGSDGRITCQYETYVPSSITSGRAAQAGVDFEHVAGELVFEHNVCKQEIVIPILPRSDLPEDVKRDEIFGVRIFNAQPSGVKISKKD